MQIEQAAGCWFLAALPALNSSLAVGHNPVLPSMLCQTTRMASLNKEGRADRWEPSVALPASVPQSSFDLLVLTHPLLQQDLKLIHKRTFHVIRSQFPLRQTGDTCRPAPERHLQLSAPDGQEWK